MNFSSASLSDDDKRSRYDQFGFAGVDPNGTFMDVPGFLASLESDIVTRNRVDLGLGLYSVGSKGSPTSIRRIGTVGSTRRNRKVLIKDPRRAADLVLGELEAME